MHFGKLILTRFDQSRDFLQLGPAVQLDVDLGRGNDRVAVLAVESGRVDAQFGALSLSFAVAHSHSLDFHVVIIYTSPKQYEQNQIQPNPSKSNEIRRN